MVSRVLKLRFRRRIRRHKLQVEELGQQAGVHLERNLFRRLERLANVRRFVITWVLLVILLGAAVVGQISALRGYYQDQTPVAGGTFIEGALGSFSDSNPLFATGPVDTAVARLAFSSLLTYDEKGSLVGDLAKSWQVDETGQIYTVTLLPHIFWHDGHKLTAKDVVYTYETIQNPDARSPLAPSWRGIKVKAQDDRTVIFTLPNTLASFPHSLTNGIVPAHLLSQESATSLRTLAFNTSPIGSGPFKLTTLEVTGGSPENRQEIIGFERFDTYHRGTPKLQRFVLRTFRNQDQMLTAFKEQKLTAMSGLTTLPDDLDAGLKIRNYSFPFSAAVMSFFKTTNQELSDSSVRKALVMGTDQAAILGSLGYPTQAVKSPLLRGQLGYDVAQEQLGFDLAAAEKLLNEGGWARGSDGIRAKGDNKLSFSLVVSKGGEYEMVSKLLAEQWQKLGIQINVNAQDVAEFQQALLNHDYDILVHGISIGEDPDVVVYWDSKYADVRADNRVNFSEYKSATADASLQAGRTRLDPLLRAIKYKPFLTAWKNDAPAVGLYEPRYLYITNGPVYGLVERRINIGTDRYSNVHNWMIRQKGISQLAL